MGSDCSRWTLSFPCHFCRSSSGAAESFGNHSIGHYFKPANLYFIPTKNCHSNSAAECTGYNNINSAGTGIYYFDYSYFKSICFKEWIRAIILDVPNSTLKSIIYLLEYMYSSCMMHKNSSIRDMITPISTNYLQIIYF